MKGMIAVLVERNAPMTSVPIRVMLFFSSYFPLVLIFCALLWGMWPLWAILLLGGLGLASLVVTLFYLEYMRRTVPARPAKIKNFTRRDADVMSYIASYLIPFVSFSLASVQQAIALIVFFGVLLIIYVRSNMIYINPMLNIAGYRLYEIEIEQGEFPRFYIARQRLKRTQDIRFIQISDEIYLEK